MIDSETEFLNKKILITGASSGVGKACALFFLNTGAKVLLCGRDVKAMKKIGENFPDQAAVIELDLSNDLQIYDLKTTVIEILGGIDLILNCAGAMFDGDIEKTFPQDFDYSIDINCRYIFYLYQNFIKYLEAGSSIINVSCLYGTLPQAGMASYCIAKSGLETMTKYMAAELAEKGVRVNAVTACPIDTNCQRYVGTTETEYQSFKDRVVKNIPLGRMASPEDIAKVIIFLASKRSSSITGQIVKVDGGRSLTSSGYAAWFGMKNMNARFEPDGNTLGGGINISSLFSFLKKKEDTEVQPVKFPETEKEIDDLINESNWSTRLSEAHEKITANYKNIDQNDDYLKEKYIGKR